MSAPAVEIREEVRPPDLDAVRAIVTSAGVFSPAEIDVAAELVAERLAKGAASGYEFLFAETGGRVIGYTCYGPIPATRSSYDLYWIAVAKDAHGRGLGRRLLAETERRVWECRGTRVYAETSGRPDYGPTRRFYERCGYAVAAVLPDFYAPGDGKVIYVKSRPDS
ncbi:MAG TPA: GNAT family N-acetyltransferase [Gemmataceae bacterium]